MKVLHVIPSLKASSGGPAQQVIQLCEGLKKEEVKIQIVTTEMDTDSKLSFPVHLFVRKFNSFLPAQFAFSPTLKTWLKGHIKEFDFLHIHYLFSYPSSIACYYARKQNVPYILAPAGMLDDFCLKKNALQKKIYMLLFEERNLRNAHAIHVTSEEEMAAVKKRGLNTRYILMPPGLNLEELKIVETLRGVFRKQHPQAIGKKIILFLSRLDPKKGLDILISALTILLQKHNDFIFLVCGSGHKAYESQVRDAVEKAGLAGLTIFTGFVTGEMKMSILADADVFVLPSYDENFGIAVTEAMAAGLPVIISNKVNIYKLIEEYNAGIVRDLNSRQIASALEVLLNDESLCREMAGKGKQLVKENFDIKIITKKMIQAYKVYGIQRPSQK